MYTWNFDKETHGILLNKKSSILSREVRPVYAKEMLNRGFDKYWKFNKDNSVPIMWAINLDFYYDDKLMITLEEAKLLSEKRSVKYINKNSIGSYLKNVNLNLMIEKNNSLLKQLEDKTLNDIYTVYKDYSKKVDLTYVAYSGGKDSEVLLNLCMRILPKDKYMVGWTNTGLEFNSTIDMVKHRKESCKKYGIKFMDFEPKIDAEEAWRKIGPPSQANRWCCYVLKSSTSITNLRNIINKKDIDVLCFLGNRIDESSKRATLQLVSGRIKNKETINCNPIAKWNSAEVFLYLYKHKIKFNQGYIDGFNRIGCAFCPLALKDSLNYFYQTKKDQAQKWYNIVASAYESNNQKWTNHVLENSIWTTRTDAEGTNYPHKYKEFFTNNTLHIQYKKLNVDWKIWLKTIGSLKDKNIVRFRSKDYKFSISNKEEWTEIIFDNLSQKEDNKFIELIKSVFRKAAFCVKCHECEVRCKKGNIIIKDDELVISDNCNKCLSCHEVPTGCFACKSRSYIKDCN